MLNFESCKYIMLHPSLGLSEMKSGLSEMKSVNKFSKNKVLKSYLILCVVQHTGLWTKNALI